MGILTLYEFGVRPFGTTEHPKCGSHCFGHWGSQPHIILGSGPSEPQSSPSWGPIALDIGDPKCTPTLQIPMQCGSIHGVNGDPNTPQVWDRAMMDPGTPQVGVPSLWPLGFPTPHHFGVHPFGLWGSHPTSFWGPPLWSLGFPPHTILGSTPLVFGVPTPHHFGVHPFGHWGSQPHMSLGSEPLRTTQHPKFGSHCFGHWGSQPHIILGPTPLAIGVPNPT